MTHTDTKTHRDLDRQSATMRLTLNLLGGLTPPANVLEARRYLFTGCGSSYYASLSAATLMTAIAGRSAVGAPSSEVWLLPEAYLDDETVVVGVSRTGTTTEVVRVLEMAREQGLATVALTLTDDAPLLDSADLKISMSHVREEGRVMTQSFSNLLLAGQWLAATVAAHAARPQGEEYLEGFVRLVDLLDGLLPELDLLGAEVAARGAGHYVLLGSGPTAAVCAEGVLKLQEMTQLTSESHSGLEYRHGPIAALGNGSQLLLASCAASVAFDALLAADARTLGHSAMVLCPADLASRFPEGTEVRPLPGGLPDWLYANVCLAFFQYLSWHRTVALGRDPERVRNLDKATTPVVDPHVVDLPPGRITS